LNLEKRKTASFFAFDNSEERDNVYSMLIKQSQLTNLEIRNQSEMTYQWQNQTISTYDYLIYLNMQAGRSFNDLTQYPIFPWILADYTSKQLDLKNPATFRDLSKPVGALNAERLKLFKQRMAQIEIGQPKFLYGTHYSNPGYVLFYLVRQEPDKMLRIQNGRFDSPSRMFHSLGETWNGVLTNQADVKELIPEFYDTNTKGTFLLNESKLFLGVKENGEFLGDVVLPPWASNANELVEKMREALECDYVSDNIDHWIDLIFGYKQTGKEALDANNLFYHLTYEGAVDIEKIKDPLEKAAIIAQIKEFGQTPTQLFKIKHPKRFVFFFLKRPLT